MRKHLAILFLIFFTLPNSYVGAKDATSKKYKSCAELLKDFPNGVAKNSGTIGSTYATVNAAVYKLNYKNLDRDKDGVACEK